MGNAPEFGEHVFELSGADEDATSNDEPYKDLPVIKAFIPISNSTWNGSVFPDGSRRIRWTCSNGVSEPEECFEEKDDAWGFTNSSENLCGLWGAIGNYYIYSSDYNKLISHMKATDIERVSFSGTNENTGKKISRYNFYYATEWPFYEMQDWTGSCNGMSTVAILLAQGKYTLKRLLLSDKQPSRIADPSKQTISTINYYHHQQSTCYNTLQMYQFETLSYTEKIRFIEELALKADFNNMPFNLKLSLPGGAAHTVVGYGIETGKWVIGVGGSDQTFNRRILIYDNSHETSTSSNENCDLYYSDLNSIVNLECIPVYNAYQFSFSNDDLVYNVVCEDNHLDMISYEDGSVNNDVQSAAVVMDYIGRQGSNERITLRFDDRILEVNGDTYEFDHNGIRLKSMPESDGVGNGMRTIALPWANEYIVKSDNDLNIRFTTENYCIYGGSKSGGELVINSIGSAAVIPKTKGLCFLHMTSNHPKNNYPATSIIAEDAKELKAEFSESGILVESDNMNDVLVTTTDYHKENALEVNTEAKNILVSTKDDNTTLLADVDEDGAYESPVGERIESHRSEQSTESNDSSNESTTNGEQSVTPAKKQKQNITIKVKSPSVKASKLTRKKVSIKKGKAFTIINAVGTVGFKKRSGSKKLAISSSGKITVSKGTKKGTYKIKVLVTASGNDNYEPFSKTVTVKVKVV